MTCELHEIPVEIFMFISISEIYVVNVINEVARVENKTLSGCSFGTFFTPSQVRFFSFCCCQMVRAFDGNMFYDVKRRRPSLYNEICHYNEICQFSKVSFKTFQGVAL